MLLRVVERGVGIDAGIDLHDAVRHRRAAFLDQTDQPVGDPDHGLAVDAILQSRGILTRKMGAYGLPQYLRITIGTGEEMERVAVAFGEIMASR